MRNFMLASAAALTFLAVPAALSAQEQGGGPESAANAAAANNQAQPGPVTTTVVNTPSTTSVVRDNPGNLTPPPASSLNKTYPVCRRGQTDNCQNPGEGGAPGRSRALPYWPGKPASEGGH